MLLAPRHPERFNEDAETIADKGLDYVRRTELSGGAIRANEPVILLDTIGELIRMYSIGTVIFIGGSLIEGIGGHNPLEPAVAGKPVIFGPHMDNFKEIARMLISRRAAFQINNHEELTKKVHELLNAPELRNTISKAALDAVQSNNGAVKKIAGIVASVLRQD